MLIASRGPGHASRETAGCGVALVGWLTSAALSASAAPNRTRILRRVAAAVGAATLVVFIAGIVFPAGR